MSKDEEEVDLTWWRKPPEVKRAYADGRFGQVHYRIAGGNEGRPPLMIFHQSPSSGRNFEHLMTHLSADRTVVAMDTPGFGDSDAPDEPPTIDDYAAVAGELGDALGFETVDVFGDHTGTKVAVELARQRPRQVRRLAMNAAMVFPATDRAQQQAIIEKEKPKPPPEDGSHQHGHWQRLAKFYEGSPLELLNRDFAEMLKGGARKWFGHNASFSYDMAEGLACVPHAVLQLCPDDGYWDTTQATMAHMRNARLVELPEFHMGAVSLHAEAVARHVRDFLDGDAEDPEDLPKAKAPPNAPRGPERQLRRGFADTSLGQVHFRQAGADGTRPALLCFHISPLSSRYCEPLLMEMARDRRVIAFDTPGYGESDRPVEQTPVEGLAAILGEAVVALGIGPADVLGDHTGAKIGLELALQRPDLIRRVTMNAAGIYTEAERAKIWPQVGPVPTRRDGAHVSAMWQRAMALRAPEEPIAATDDLFCEVMRPGPAMWWGPRAAQVYDLAEKLPSLTQPLQILDARLDPISPMTQRAAPLLRNGRIVRLEGIGFGLMSVHAATVGRHLRDFLDT